jgi:serine/threonine protein kinase
MSSPTPAPERSSVSTPGENVAYIAPTSSPTGSTEPAALPPATPVSADPMNVDGGATIKSGGVPLNAWQSSAAELANLLVGKQLGPFLIEASLGTGGMAAVFRAYDVQLDRKVALKILPPVLAARTDHVQRFEREAKVTAKLDHEHVARVHQYGQDQGLHYIAYEYVEGTNLRDVMSQQGGRLAVADAVRYVLQAALGLAHTAARGVIHRDIKPSNLVITAEGKVKLVDLGLARNCLMEDTQDLTHSGATLGTFDYLAPEQAIDPRSADVRSDIYSLGCTLYHCVTGRPPVPQGTAARKLHSHQVELPIDPTEFNPEVPVQLVNVLSRMLAKAPEDRYQSADELVRELEPLVSYRVLVPTPQPLPPPVQEPGMSWIPWAVAVVLLIAGTLGYEALFGVRQSRLEDLALKSDRSADPKGRVADDTNQGHPVVGEQAPVTVEVRTGEELQQALRGASGGTILLRGSTFDLSPISDADAAMMVRGGDWQVRPAEGFRPVLRLKPASNSSGSTLIELAARSLQLKQVRLEVPDTRHDVFLIHGGSELTVYDCELVQGSGGKESDLSSARALIRIPTDSAETSHTTVLLHGCVLHGGDVALDQRAAGLVQWEHCWVGPYRLFANLPALSQGSNPRRVVSLKQCCVLQPRKACFQVAGTSPTNLEVGQCLFSRSSPSLPSVQDESVWLLREEGANLDLNASENVFHRVPVLYSSKSGEGTETIARDWNHLRSIYPRARGAGSTHIFRSPWVESRPWQKYQETSQLQALLPREDFRDTCPDSLLAQPFRTVTLASRGNALPPQRAGRILTVDGRGEEAGTFTTVNSALGSITDEEETTILIQQQGTVAIKPSELGNSRVILKSGEGFSPTLVFHRDTVSGPDGDTSLFRIHDGEMTLEGLRVRLEPLRDPARSLSLVAISGTGRCKLKDSIVTLKTGGEVLAMVCLIADPTGMMSPSPGKAPRHGAARVELADSFVRGTGEIVHVQTSRPFVAHAQNCGVVLDGTAFVVEGNRADMGMPAEQAQLTLERSTVHATKGVIQLHGTPGMPQLVPVRCHVSQCLLSADAQPLVRVDANQAETELRRKLIWTGKRNCYAVSGSLLQWQSLDRETLASQYDASLWSELWGADDEQAQILKSVLFTGNSRSTNFADWEPGDLMPKLDAASSMALREIGVVPDQLPQLQSATP